MPWPEQLLAQLLHGQAVLLRHFRHGPIHFRRRRQHADLLGVLRLGPGQDHLLEHLAHQHVLRRRRAALVAQLLLHDGDPALELARGDRLLVHDRDDAVDRLARGRCAGRAAGAIAAASRRLITAAMAAMTLSTILGTSLVTVKAR